MKNIKLSALLLFLLCLSFSSCKKDEEEEPSPKSMIVGKWFVKKAVVTSYNGTTLTGTTTFSDYTAADFFELKSDGKFLYPNEGQVALEVGTYEINDAGTKLTLNETDDVEVYDVKTLTDTELVISQEFTSTENGVTTRYVETISHSKTAF